MIFSTYCQNSSLTNTSPSSVNLVRFWVLWSSRKSKSSKVSWTSSLTTLSRFDNDTPRSLELNLCYISETSYLTKDFFQLRHKTCPKKKHESWRTVSEVSKNFPSTNFPRQLFWYSLNQIIIFNNLPHEYLIVWDKVKKNPLQVSLLFMVEFSHYVLEAQTYLNGSREERKWKRLPSEVDIFSSLF